TVDVYVVESFFAAAVCAGGEGGASTCFGEVMAAEKWSTAQATTPPAATNATIGQALPFEGCAARSSSRVVTAVSGVFIARLSLGSIAPEASSIGIDFSAPSASAPSRSLA